MAMPTEIRLRGTAEQLNQLVDQMRETFGDRIVSVSQKYMDRRERTGFSGTDTYRIYIKLR